MKLFICGEFGFILEHFVLVRRMLLYVQYYTTVYYNKLICRSVSAFDELKAHFYERRVQKCYWCLVSRIPSLEAGIIDVPLAEGFINGVYKVTRG